MKIQWKKLIICILIPLAVGGASAFLTRDGIQVFEWINKPPLSPPAWLFPVAWTILYVLMGIASYLVLVNEKKPGPCSYSLRNTTVFQLCLAYHLLQHGSLSAGIYMAGSDVDPHHRHNHSVQKVSKAAALLLIPYILWVAFAGYLNFGIYLLN